VRILGLDVGDRRVGVAISDPNGRVAVPLRTLQRTSVLEVVAAIARLVAEEEVSAIIVGLPLRMDGSAGTQATSVQEFVQNLMPAVSVPVTLWDERLSTVEAEQRLRTGGSSGRKKAEQDALAAAIILQGYLDSRPGRQTG
jgi:putative Holliday junction resolvase